MRPAIILCLLLCVLFGMCPRVNAERGFSIEGGLLYDKPLGGTQKPYHDIQGGFGYIANFAYDFFEWGGLEFGVMHTSHEFELAVVNNAVNQGNASKTTLFLKARACPLRIGKSELIVGLGAGLFEISGTTIVDNFEVSDDFSGLGFLTSLDYRYKISPGLELSAHLGMNFVNYNRYEINGYKSDYPGSMPDGKSLCWGITVFHRIGIPQI